jgi:hypothetical protein
VVTQYKALQANPGMNGFTAAFTSPMLITGGAKIFTMYASKETFNGEIIIRFSTDGKIPGHRQAELRSRQPEHHWAPVRRSLQDRLGRGHGAVPRRHPGPGAAAHHRRPLQDGLPQPPAAKTPSSRSSIRRPASPTRGSRDPTAAA